MNKDAPRVQHRRMYVCGILPLLGGAVVSLTTFWGCGERHQLRNDELYRRIQVHEQHIREAEVAVRAAQSCREAHEPAERGVCDESKALCKLTVRNEQTDALRRCILASDSCRAVRERTRGLCATHATP